MEESPKTTTKKNQGVRTAKFEEFIKKTQTKKMVKEWKRKWKYTKRGIMALLHVLWLNGGSDSNVLKTANDILSKLKGQDIFAKFLNVLKLSPEDKMS